VLDCAASLKVEQTRAAVASCLAESQLNIAQREAASKSKSCVPDSDAPVCMLSGVDDPSMSEGQGDFVHWVGNALHC